MSATYSTKEFPDKYVNPRGIPQVPFVESVEDLIKSRGVTSETILKQFQEQYSKYKLMEHKLSQNKSLLQAKSPEIEKTMETVKYLKQKLEVEQLPINTQFGLTESVFVDAIVSPQHTIHLWLGANVMCEYTYDAALQMLKKNLDAAKLNLANTIEDLAWLKDQQVILEVNTARVYNFDVIARRETK